MIQSALQKVDPEHRTVLLQLIRYAFAGFSTPPLCFVPPLVEIRSGETTLVRIEECAGAWRKLRFPTAGRVPLSVSGIIRNGGGQVRQHMILTFSRETESDWDVLLPIGSYQLEARTADGKSATTPFEVTNNDTAPPVAVRLP